MTSLLTTIQTSTINGNYGSTLTIGNNLTTDAIQLGTSTNTITIGGASTTTTVGGTLQTSTLNSQTNILNIGQSTSTINIGHSNTLGSTTNNGNLTVTSLLTTNGFTINGGNNITLGNGSSAPLNNQLGYVISTTTENPSIAGTPIQSRVFFNSAFNVFSDNNSQGILLSPGTWLITYNIIIYVNDSTVANWVYNLESSIVTGANKTTYGTIVGGQLYINFKNLTNYGYSLGAGQFLTATGNIIKQITASTYYNVRLAVLTVSTPSGTLGVDPTLTAVRIA